MIPIHPDLISQLIADRQAGLMASAQQRRAWQARAARRARPAKRGHAAPKLAALGRLAWRRSSPRTVQTPAAGGGILIGEVQCGRVEDGSSVRRL